MEVKSAILQVRSGLSFQSSGVTEPDEIPITKLFITQVVKRLFNILDCEVVSCLVANSKFIFFRFH